MGVEHKVVDGFIWQKPEVKRFKTSTAAFASA